MDPRIGGSVDTNNDGVLQRSLRIPREISRGSNCKQPKQSLQPYHLRDNHRLCFSFDPVDECSIKLMKYELRKVFVERDLEFRTHCGAFYFPTSNMMEVAEKVGNHSSTTMQSNHRAEMCGQTDAVENKPTSCGFYLSGAVRTWNMKFMDKEFSFRQNSELAPSRKATCLQEQHHIENIDGMLLIRLIWLSRPGGSDGGEEGTWPYSDDIGEFMLNMNVFPYSNDDDYWVMGESEVSQLEFMLQKYSVNSLHRDDVYYVKEAMDDGLRDSEANNTNSENKFVIDAGEPNKELWCNTKVVDAKSRNMFVYLLNRRQAGTCGISAREAVMIDLERFTDHTETIRTVALVELFAGWVVDSNRVNHPDLSKFILVSLREGSSLRKWVRFAHGGASVWDGWGKNCCADGPGHGGAHLGCEKVQLARRGAVLEHMHRIYTAGIVLESK
ncbi:hypothetical protein K438DRAFT_1752047 [Mycena galopus ATCC 62051]|nr:hypothetical protein K438DRAFT_1752047 [Mycena galopus ATCC 62051]